MEQKDMSEQPIFVRVEEYQDILDLLTLIRERIGKAGALIQQVSKIKQEEEVELAQWSRSLGELDQKLAEIDRLLFQPKRF